MGIEHDASEMEIKRSFRKRSRELHPEFNSAPDAEQQFILLNEAYDILTHRKTRELFEEDLGTYHNPETYPSYKHYVTIARERATVHARLPFKEFTRSKFYQSTHTYPYVMFVAEMVGALLMICVPYLLMVSENNKPIGVASLFVALPAGIFFLVQSLSGFSAMKKYKGKTKVSKVKAQVQKS